MEVSSYKNSKIEAVRLVIEQGRIASSVAKKLYIHENTVRKWIREYRLHHDEAFSGSGNLKSQDEELRQLKKRIADLRRKCDTKKSRGHLSKTPEVICSFIYKHRSIDTYESSRITHTLKTQGIP